MDQDRYEMEAENSFLFFLILVQALSLSDQAFTLITSSNMDLKKFIWRNKCYLQKPDGVLVL